MQELLRIYFAELLQIDFGLSFLAIVLPDQKTHAFEILIKFVSKEVVHIMPSHRTTWFSSTTGIAKCAGFCKLDGYDSFILLFGFIFKKS